MRYCGPQVLRCVSKTGVFSMSHRHGWRFSWVTTWNEIWDSSFVTQWQKWMESSPDSHVFFEPSMVRMWVRYFQTRERVEPRFLVGEHVSGCKVLFPLVRVQYGWKDSWCRVLQPAGADSFDYHDPIFSENSGEFVSSFWTAFAEESIRSFGRAVDQVVIPRVRESCVGACQDFHAVERSPFIDLHDVAGIDTPLANIPNKLRRDVQRQVRRLEKLGHLQLRMFGADELDLATDALDGLARAYCDKWRVSRKAMDIYTQMLEACLPEDFFHMSVLESNGVPISWHIGFLHKRRFYHYKLAFDVRFWNYSPGQVHRMKLVEEGLHQGATVFDFLRGEEEYKYHWTKSSIGLYQMQIGGPTLRSQIARRARRLMCGSRRRMRELGQHYYRKS